MTHNQFSGGQARNVVQAGSVGRIDLTVPAAPLPEPDPDARRLAGLVGGQWRAEAAARGLFGPLPLPVPWRTEHRLADHPELTGAPPDEVGTRTRPAEIAEMFLALPERRLVILGSAGSGKTSLAVLLLIELIDRLGPQDPVPVLVPLASWQPGKQRLREWFAERISKDYPTVPVARLLAERRLLPVLDGFDELPPELRADALRAINRDLTPGDPLVLTSRAEAYRRAAEGSRVLHASAAVHSRPIPAAGVTEALRHHAGPQHLARWQPVLDEIAAHPAGPLTRTLANPLFLGLAREAHTAPADLLRFPDRQSLTDHLLDRFVPALAPDAVRTLRDIAAHDEPDIAWWRLHWRVANLFTVSKWPWVSIFVATLSGLAVLYSYSPYAALVYCTVTITVCSLTLGLGSGGYEGLLRLKGRLNPVVHSTPGKIAALTPLLLGPLFALLLASTRTLGLMTPVSLVGTVSVQCSLSALLLLTIRRWARQSARSMSVEEQSSPAAALRAGRRRAVTMGTVVGSVSYAVLCVGLGGPQLGAALWCSLLPAALAVFGSEWGAYTITRLLLAAAGRIPLRYAAFLAEAHRLGLLRRVGSVYQFRHESLRERLAQQAP
ncbi:NACHT domain-containing protein [Kitasatospora cineracea]|uniref:NACHT domain-containing protein n=1 Tax=Kitasatospora cineracea TaxID=88074 RepID=UPI00379EBD08